MKLAFVIHRYGREMAGGSEAHCRQLAERLLPNHDITVLTTCARDYVTWANAYAPGETDINGVHVVRFPVRRPRRLKTFADLSDEVFETRASVDRQDAWFAENGPDAPALLDYLRAHGREYDLVLFWSFRYAPAYFGLPLVADRAVLVPTAEDDPAIRLDVLEEYFRKPAGYLFLTPEEETLVSKRARQPLTPAAIIGSGLEPAPSPSDRAALDALHLPRDFVLYLGRIDRNKGCYTLFEYFEQHLADGGKDTTLVLAGPATIPVPEHPRIRALGFVEDHVREALLDHAHALIVPSPYESLSIALLEGWNHAIPALVNGDCLVLKGQVRRANGGLYYRSAKDFSAGLTWLLEHDADARALGRQGRDYVDLEYRWPVVVARVEALLAEAKRPLG
ncbi:MAG: glycosyltransferase family 4 protein [Acidobacteriota bacterium]|nr:glycosyltransferase family 4 protein [Acidobacteriota bacterium]